MDDIAERVSAATLPAGKRGPYRKRENALVLKHVTYVAFLPLTNIACAHTSVMLTRPALMDGTTAWSLVGTQNGPFRSGEGRLSLGAGDGRVGSVDPHHVPVPTGETPVFTIAGVALPLDRWREYDRKYLYLKREFFAAEIDKSSKIDSAWEAKGTYLLGPHNANSERNKVFCYKVLDLVKEFDGKAMGVTFLKGVRDPMHKTSIYTKGLQILAERFDIFLREDNATGILILDSRMAHAQKGKGLDRTVAMSYLSFVFGNKYGQLLRRIVEAPMFADSALTAGLQIADIVAFMIYGNNYCEKLAPDGKVDELGYLDYTHIKRYSKPLRELTFESQNSYGGGKKMYGLRTIDHRDAPPSRASLDALKARYDKKPSGSSA